MLSGCIVLLSSSEITALNDTSTACLVPLGAQNDGWVWVAGPVAKALSACHATAHYR